MFDSILVPTDGSENSKEAARDAIEIAKDSGGTVHALYVMDMGEVGYVSTPSDIEEVRNRLEHKGDDFVDEIERMADAEGIRCLKEVRSGIPENEIIDYAEEHGVDLIIMGKRGRADPDKPAFGSTTNRVIGMTDITVLTT